MFTNKYRKEFFLFLLAFGFRLILVIIMRVKTGSGLDDFILAGDANSYYKLAFNLKYFFSFSLPPVLDISDAFLRTPGYPVFLAIIFKIFSESLTAAMLVQAIFAGLSAVLVFRIALKINLNHRLAIIAGLLFALEPMAAIISISILTETLFTFIFLIFIYFFIGFLKSNSSPKKFLILGLIFGLGVLTRPVLYPFLLVVAFFNLFYFYHSNQIKNGFIKTAFIIIGTYLIIFPWLLRNKIVYNQWAVSSISSNHFFYSYAIPFHAYKLGVADKDLVVEEFKKKMAPLLVGDKYDIRNNAVYNKEAKKIILSDPIGYGFYHLTNSVSFFFSNGYRNLGRELGFNSFSPPLNYSFVRLFLGGNLKGLFVFFKDNFSQFLIFIAGFIFWLVINILMLLGVIKGLFFESDRSKRGVILFFTLTVLFFALTAGPEAYYKMRFPANPLIFIISIFGFSVVQPIKRIR